MESTSAALELTFQYLSPETRNPETEEKIRAFKIKYFGVSGDRHFTAWKYSHGPIDCGDCRIIALTPSGEIAGHLGAVVFPTVPGCPVPRLALGTEFIVDENYRSGKYDVIRKMDSMLGERLAEKGVELMYGTPNKPGYIVARRLHRRSDGPKCGYVSKVFTPALAVPGRFRKPVHALLSFFARTRPALPPGWTWSSPAAFDAAEIDAFCRDFARGLDFGTFRNPAFLNWRYGGGDGAHYERVILADRGKVIGLGVFRVNPRRCMGALLMECMALEDRGHHALLSVCEYLCSRHSPALCALVPMNAPAYAAYLQHGFRPNSQILEGVGRVLAWVPAKWRDRLLAIAENHFHVDNHTTLYYYPDAKRTPEFAKGRWYLTLGEKYGF